MSGSDPLYQYEAVWSIIQEVLKRHHSNAEITGISRDTIHKMAVFVDFVETPQDTPEWRAKFLDALRERYPDVNIAVSFSKNPLMKGKFE